MSHRGLATVANHDRRLPAAADLHMPVSVNICDSRLETVEVRTPRDITAVPVGIAGHDPQLLRLAVAKRPFPRKHVESVDPGRPRRLTDTRPPGPVGDPGLQHVV